MKARVHAELKVENCAWAAGFIDGEGCLRLTSKRAQGRRHRQYFIHLDAGQVDPRPLFKLKEMFGGAIHFNEIRKQGWSHYYRWIASSQEAANAIRLMRPYLIVKAEQADLLLEFQARITKGRASMSASELAYRESIRVAVSALNKKGMSKNQASTAAILIQQKRGGPPQLRLMPDEAAADA